ncbi:sulfite exporter TauE/SafE family protein [Rhodococcus sp. JS3073]|uniref:sulfite exporter TauE/SafE family protein n=1 Tax=Rhodococcus sp. JS3073 TaxID=3002901 RepID=UPI0022868550|nr:sulfite exporter TauE/SafE family protein [Rhodococcus sp. JS3073]WAM19382.1 sulfite exporter TauE/SafE family protein [Rhodococcus sp. JS3073]
MIVISVALGACIGLCLGALGGGGSIITVPALVYLLHQPLQTAITQSLVIVGISSAVAMLAHARGGRVRWRAGICLGAVGGGAASAGTALGRLVSPAATLAAFSVLMMVVAISLLMRATTRSSAQHDSARTPVTVGAPTTTGAREEVTGSDDNRSPGRVVTAVKIVLTGTAIGLLTGFFGVGGGFVIVPALVLFLGYSMPVAVGTSLLVITLNSAFALGARVGEDSLDATIILPVAAAAIIGSIAGKYATQRVSEAALTRAFAALLVVVAGYVAARSLGLVPQ